MKINIVIPCYNEQEVLTKTIEVLGKLSGRIKQETAVDTQLCLSMMAATTRLGR